MLTENGYIKIMSTKEADIPFVIEAEQKAENAKYVSQWSAEEHTSALKDADTLHLTVRDINGAHIGYLIIKGMTNQNKSIELMRIVITKKGLGYGKAAISLIKKWCFAEQQAHRLWLDVQEDNLRAQHVYETLGFKREGVLRECVKTAEGYKSLVVMAILSHEYHA